MSPTKIAFVCVAVIVSVSLLDYMSGVSTETLGYSGAATSSSASSKHYTYSTLPAPVPLHQEVVTHTSSSSPSIPLIERRFGEDKDQYNLFTSALPADCPDCTPLVSHLTMIEADACGTPLTVDAAKRTAKSNPVFDYLLAVRSITSEDDEFYQSALQTAQETVVCGDFDSWYGQFRLIINATFGKESEEAPDTQVQPI